jgi:hypothetical protein
MSAAAIVACLKGIVQQGYYTKLCVWGQVFGTDGDEPINVTAPPACRGPMIPAAILFVPLLVILLIVGGISFLVWRHRRARRMQDDERP